MATTKTVKNTTTKKTNPVTKHSATATKTAAKTATKKAVKAEPKIAPKPATKKTANAVPVQISHETIAREAYFLWQSRGGCEMENWLEAEQKVRSRGGSR